MCTAEDLMTTDKGGPKKKHSQTPWCPINPRPTLLDVAWSVAVSVARVHPTCGGSGPDDGASLSATNEIWLPRLVLSSWSGPGVAVFVCVGGEASRGVIHL